jgi:hypothetical protein
MGKSFHVDRVQAAEAWTWQPPSAAGDARVERRSKEAREEVEVPLSIFVPL